MSETFAAGPAVKVDDVRLLATFGERLRGLLGTASDAGSVLLVGCHAIHTYGMRYALDVAFISRRGHVLRSERQVAPGGHLSCLGAAYVLERPSSTCAWPAVGSWLELGMTFHEGEGDAMVADDMAPREEEER